MPMSQSDHARVASSLDSFSDSELEQLSKEFEDMFAEVEVKKSVGLDVEMSKKELEIAIEGYTKLQARILNKGWLFRTKLRTQLIMKLT